MTNEDILSKMEEEIHLRGLSRHTREEYITRTRIAMRYFNCPLEDLNEQNLRQFLLYLLDEKKLSSGSVNGYNSALRFVYGSVIGRSMNHYQLPRQKEAHQLPQILTREEVFSLFDSADNLRDKAMLMTVYGGGLRGAELVNLKTSDIYASTMRILIRQGKGKKDRFTLLSKTNLDILTQYWYAYKPRHTHNYLFLSRSHDKMTTRSLQNAFHKALKKSGIKKEVTLHTLRHCFATHIMENGADVCQIKKLLGHTYIQTTSKYLHLINFEDSLTSPLDAPPKKPAKRGRPKGSKNKTHSPENGGEANA